jgi:hypothetical protein
MGLHTPLDGLRLDVETNSIKISHTLAHMRLSLARIAGSLKNDGPLREAESDDEMEFELERTGDLLMFQTIGGKKDAVVGAITGDNTREAAGNLRKDKGQAQQEINK